MIHDHDHHHHQLFTCRLSSLPSSGQKAELVGKFPTPSSQIPLQRRIASSPVLLLNGGNVAIPTVSSSSESVNVAIASIQLSRVSNLYSSSCSSSIFCWVPPSFKLANVEVELANLRNFF